MTTPRLAEARERLLARCRTVIQAHLADRTAAIDVATGRAAAGRTTPAIRSLSLGVNAFAVPESVDQTPAMCVVEAGGQVRQENIHGTQDEEITLALFVTHTVDIANIEDAAQTVRILATAAGDVLAEHLAEPLNTANGSCWLCEVVSSAPDEPQQDGETLWVISYGVELRAIIRYQSPYSPLTMPVGYSALPWRQSDAVRASVSVAATGTAVPAIACAVGAVATLQLTAGELAATTALALTWPASTFATATAFAVAQGQVSPSTSTGAVVAQSYSIPVATIPLADGVEILITVVDGATLAAGVYRIRIEVT